LYTGHWQAGGQSRYNQGMESKDIRQRDPNASVRLAAPDLSDREREILVLVASGASNKEIAQQLVISPNTVKVHVRNIFGKIGVSSRTEAALYAVRAGLVRVAADQPAAAEAESVGDYETADAPATVIPLAPAAPNSPPAPSPTPPPHVRSARWLAASALVLTLLFLGAVVVSPRLRPTANAPTAPPATSLPRWQARTAMSTARNRLAVVTYENYVYAIGGETSQGVSNVTERYDTNGDAWSTVAAKPLAVADASAAVLGGLIYVPGGRLASGAVTDAMEVYDPAADKWSARASLPAGLSGYALAALEGRLYVFGGWNGANFVASVYEYDPAADEWLERTRMPTVRGFAAAASVGGKIYVIGGTAGREALRVNEAYSPARDTNVANPWQTMEPAPGTYEAVAAAALAESVYLVGHDVAGGTISAWNYRPERNEWQPLEQVEAFAPGWFGVAALQTRLYVLGGSQADGTADQMMTYQALYTSLIPVFTSGE
jgi:DNA-binding CsgD family transcriptional regulator/N-acetylneuraminic acid mutarotase